MPRYYDHVEQWDPGDVLPPGGGGMIPDAPAPPQIPIDEWTPPGYFPGLMPDYGFEDSTTVSAPDQPSVGSAPGSGGGTVPTLPGGGGGGGFNLGDLFGKLKKINPQQAAAIAMLAQQLFGGGRRAAVALAAAEGSPPASGTPEPPDAAVASAGAAPSGRDAARHEPAAELRVSPGPRSPADRIRQWH